MGIVNAIDSRGLGRERDNTVQRCFRREVTTHLRSATLSTGTRHARLGRPMSPRP